MIVVFALVPDRQDRRDLAVLDLEQQHIPADAKANDKFAQEGITRVGFASAQRSQFQNFDAIADGLQGAFGHAEVAFGPLQQPIVEVLHILLRVFRETDLEAHAIQPLRALSKRD